jgi:predicted dehydrogenase
MAEPRLHFGSVGGVAGPGGERSQHALVGVEPLMAEPLIRLGIVGAGRRSQQHLATIRGLTDLFQVAAICDASPAVAERVAAELECDAYTDPRECLAKGGLDAVLITTPPEAHHLVAVVAARAGTPMLIETTLGLTRPMMDAIAEAAAKSGVFVEVAENYGRRPAEQLNAAAIRAGLIGDLVHLSVYNAPANEESCYHTMSLLRSYAGCDVTEIRAAGRLVPNGPVREGWPESWIDATLTFENGITASVSYTTAWVTPLRWGRPRIATAEGTNGYILTSEGTPDRLRRGENGQAVDHPIQVETRSGANGNIPTTYSYGSDLGVEWTNPFADRVLADGGPVGVADGIARAIELRKLHRGVTGGGAPGWTIAQARRSQELGIAIAEAARLGTPMPAHPEEETSWEREQHAAIAQRWGIDPLDDVDRVLDHLAAHR